MAACGHFLFPSYKEFPSVCMDKAQQIANLVAGPIAGFGLEVWGVEYMPRSGSALVRLYIDHPEREVTIDDCELVSREVAAQFDVEDPIAGQYTLEVSSPGLDRPFFRAAQLARFLGERIEASLHAPVDGRRRFQGVIAAVDGEQIRLVLDDGGGDFSFEFTQAARIRLKPDYAKILGQAGRGDTGPAVNGDSR